MLKQKGRRTDRELANLLQDKGLDPNFTVMLKENGLDPMILALLQRSSLDADREHRDSNPPITDSNDVEDVLANHISFSEELRLQGLGKWIQRCRAYSRDLLLQQFCFSTWTNIEGINSDKRIDSRRPILALHSSSYRSVLQEPEVRSSYVDRNLEHNSSLVVCSSSGLESQGGDSSTSTSANQQILDLNLALAF
ncbi:hypothetical protein BC332_21821 [Capsicum chinense]|nr:hypothetical protein BC332_21821 [Capsicum chinense]